MEIVVERCGLRRVGLALLFLSCVILVERPGFAVQSVSLAWDPSSPETGVAGYNVYYGVASRVYTNIVTAGNATNATVSGLVEGQTYYFAATAYDSIGTESDFSNEVSYSVPGTPVSNAPPTIGLIGNQVIQQGSSTAVIPFTVGDPDSLISSLTLSGWSSYPQLVPAANIVFGGSGANRTVQVTPTANMWGGATISVAVTDNTGEIAVQTFFLTINSNVVTAPPTISVIANQTIQESSSTGPIPFTIADSDTALANLTLTRSSSDTQLVPLANVVLGGSGANRTVTVTPATGKFGGATITISVADNTGNTASRTFALTVTSNAPPTITTIANQTIQESSSTGPLPFTIADPDTALANLTVTRSSSDVQLVPLANVVLGGSGANRSVTVTPATGKFGVANITVTVADNLGKTAARTFALTVASNASPTISVIANQTIQESSSTGPLPFTIGDPDTALANLTVAMSSSDTQLVPLANVVLGGSGANRSVTVTPATGKFGGATITINVADNTGKTAAQSFVLTVASNAPPTITTIANQTIQENSSTGPLPFTIGDPDTALANLTVTRSSSDTQLVPLANVVLGGSGAYRTVTVTPATGKFGVANITLSVADNLGKTTARSFTLTVNSNIVTAPPVISVIANQTIQEDSTTGPVPFTVSDSDTPATSLTFSRWSSDPQLVPLANIVFGGSGANRTVQATPAADKFGVASITVIVADDYGNTASRTFALTVISNVVVKAKPVISAIADLSITKNTSTPDMPFVISDADTAVGNLTITVASSNPWLVPLSNIVIGGSGANRTCRVTPVADRTGVAAVTITVADDTGNTTSDFFFVTVVAPAPTANPSISDIPDQTIPVNSATADLPFVIGDADTALANLTVWVDSSDSALAPLSSIVLSGSGSNRVCKVTPVSDQTGSATIVVYVTDNTGNTASDAFELTVTNLPPKPLVLRTNGSGTITPNLAAQTVTFGKSYSVTAKPATGQVFAGWTGSIVSSSTTLKFLLTSNMVLQANFIPNPYVPVSGAYNGLFFEDEGIRPESAGFVTASLTSGGSYSGKLQIGNNKFSFSGKLNLQCQATNRIKRGTNYMTVTLQADQTGRLAGNVAFGSWRSSLEATRAVYNSKTRPAPFAGNYTLAMPGQPGVASLPAGHSFGTLRVSTAGSASFAGTLGDGTKVSQGVTLSQDAQWPFYASIYSGKGILIGAPVFADDAWSDFNGPVFWIKLPNASSRFYPAGFEQENYTLGSLYLAPKGTNSVVPVPELLVNFTGGNLPCNFTNVVAVGLASKITNLSTNKLGMKFSTGNGTYSGSVADPLTGKTFSFSGAVLQKRNAGYGLLSGTNQTSQVLVMP